MFQVRVVWRVEFIKQSHVKQLKIREGKEKMLMGREILKV